MKCPNCGGQMGLEDEQCPYCGTPNAMAIQHQSDMAHFRQEYQRTQADVAQKTSFMRRQDSWLVILAVLLVAAVVSVVLQVNAWEIGYSIRQGNVMRAYTEDSQVMDGYLAQGDYGKFVGYYEANDISAVDDNEYQGVLTAARPYVDLLEYVTPARDGEHFAFQPERIATTAGYIAEDLNRVYTIEQRYSYNLDQYLPADKRAYVDDIRSRCAVIATTYFGLSDEQVREIPNLSTKRLAELIEEGMAR